MTIARLRPKVEDIDRRIIDLLKKRFQITKNIQDIKRKLGIQITQKIREKALLKEYSTIAIHSKLPNGLVKKIFTIIFSYAKKTGIIKRT